METMGKRRLIEDPVQVLIDGLADDLTKLTITMAIIERDPKSESIRRETLEMRTAISAALLKFTRLRKIV
jgi:hypothetical protein